MMRLLFIASVFLLLGLMPGCGSGSGGVKAAGTLTNPDAAHTRFTINPLTSWSGFVPNGTSVDVATTAQTSFFDAQGGSMTSDSFYALVTQSAQPGTFHVKVQGTGDASLITAARVELSH
jgi:hypothetical protein